MKNDPVVECSLASAGDFLTAAAAKACVPRGGGDSGIPAQLSLPPLDSRSTVTCLASPRAHSALLPKANNSLPPPLATDEVTRWSIGDERCGDVMSV